MGILQGAFIPSWSVSSCNILLGFLLLAICTSGKLQTPQQRPSWFPFWRHLATLPWLFTVIKVKSNTTNAGENNYVGLPTEMCPQNTKTSPHKKEISAAYRYIKSTKERGCQIPATPIIYYSNVEGKEHHTSQQNNKPQDDTSLQLMKQTTTISWQRTEVLQMTTPLTTEESRH